MVGDNLRGLKVALTAQRRKGSVLYESKLPLFVCFLSVAATSLRHLSAAVGVNTRSAEEKKGKKTLVKGKIIICNRLL